MAEVEKQVVVEREPGSNVGTIIAVIIGIILLILVLTYGIPYLSGTNSTGTDVNVENSAPAGSSTGN